MTLIQILFGVALVLILLVVAGVTIRKQVAVLRGERPAGEDDSHWRGRAWRRLIGSVLMLVLALLLGGALLFLEAPLQDLINQEPLPGEKAEHKGLTKFYRNYWLTVLLVLLLLLVVTGVDLWVVRRYGKRQMARLQEDRRAMIERQSALLREERRRQGDSNGTLA